MEIVSVVTPYLVPQQLRDFFVRYVREFGANAAASETLVAEYAWEMRQDNILVGFIWVQNNHGKLYRSTAVFPDFQRRGFGLEAQWLTEQILAEHGVETLFAQVNTNSPETGYPTRRSLLRRGYSYIPDEVFHLPPNASIEKVLKFPVPVVFQKAIGLTEAEHAEAQKLAYGYAQDRGRGQLPNYNPSQAAEDFCRAAGEIIRQRQLPAWANARLPHNS